jgi:hypothetical protein
MKEEKIIDEKPVIIKKETFNKPIIASHEI